MPGTNLWLHMFTIAYVPVPNLTLDLTMHISRRLVTGTGANDNWLTRPHVAASVRF